MKTLTLYRNALSGHSHRVELFLSLLGIEATLVEVDLAKQDHRQPEFLQKNSLGQVPVLEDGKFTIADSNAILVYLATKYDPMRQWLPAAASTSALIQCFLSLAAGPLAYGLAASRKVNLFGAQLDQKKAIELSLRFLASLEDYLINRLWLAAERPTIADIALYTYTAHAPEANVCLKPYPAVRYWLRRIEGLCGFVPMQPSAVGLNGK